MSRRAPQRPAARSAQEATIARVATHAGDNGDRVLGRPPALASSTVCIQRAPLISHAVSA